MMSMKTSSLPLIPEKNFNQFSKSDLTPIDLLLLLLKSMGVIPFDSNKHSATYVNVLVGRRKQGVSEK